MIELDYTLSADWNSRGAQVEWASADEMTLRYSAFAGDVVFVVNGHDFSARWGWIPLLDFAAGMARVVRDLERGASLRVFEFKESSACLSFSRMDAQVAITSTYSDAAAVVELSELADTCDAFAARVLDDAQRQHPELRRNPTLPQWFPGANA